MLFDPRMHEPLIDAPWDAGEAERAIAGIAAGTQAALTERWWPVHELDYDVGDPGVWHGLYMGAAGVMLALERLGAPVGRDDLLASYLAAPEFDRDPGLWIGEGGITLVAYLLSREPALADRLAELVVVPEPDTLELMWGSPGLLVIADVMERETGEARFRDAADALVAYLVGREWVQDLYGRQVEYLGPAHGFAGIVAALARRGVYDPRTLEVLEANAYWEDSLVNWPPVVGEGLEHNDTIRLQWCHGAPGMVTSLAALPPDDELDALLLAGGELTWAAGPLTKGPGLCHGTAGNGFAFLKLFTRTGDELWLERARRFAMHAAARLQGRYTLWTGDLGVACFLDACLKGHSELPALDAW